MVVKTFNDEKLHKLISESDPYIQKYIKALKTTSDNWKDIAYQSKSKLLAKSHNKDYAKCPKEKVTENSCHAYENGYCKFALKTDDFA